MRMTIQDLTRDLRDSFSNLQASWNDIVLEMRSMLFSNNHKKETMELVDRMCSVDNATSISAATFRELMLRKRDLSPKKRFSTYTFSCFDGPGKTSNGRSAHS